MWGLFHLTQFAMEQQSTNCHVFFLPKKVYGNEREYSPLFKWLLYEHELKYIGIEKYKAGEMPSTILNLPSKDETYFYILNHENDLSLYEPELIKWLVMDKLNASLPKFVSVNKESFNKSERTSIVLDID